MDENIPDIGAINWFVHVLSENVGHVTWDGPIGLHDGKMPVRHPIPEGNDIILKCSRTFSIKCDSIYTKNLIIEMAKRYKSIEDENNRNKRENAADHWIPVADIPERWTSPYSSIGYHACLVTSPVLRYVAYNGVCKGLFNGQKKAWFIELNGKLIQHDEVTHWRYIPPAPVEAPKYEEVREKVEKLRAQMEWGSENDAVKEKFNILKNKWISECRFISSASEIILNMNYQSIIGMGKAVVPILIEELRNSPNQWFFALVAITGENPVPEELNGNMGKMIELWSEWGKKRGI